MKHNILTKTFCTLLIISLGIFGGLNNLNSPSTAKAFDPSDAYNPTNLTAIDPNATGPFIGSDLGQNTTQPSNPTCTNGSLQSTDYDIAYGREYYVSFWVQNTAEVTLKVQGQTPYYYIMASRTFKSNSSWQKFSYKFYGTANEKAWFNLSSNAQVCFGNFQFINTGMLNKTGLNSTIGNEFFGHHNSGYYDGSNGWPSDSGFKMGFLRSFYCDSRNDDGTYQGLSQYQRTQQRGQELVCTFNYPSTVSNPNESRILSDQEIRDKARIMATAYKGKVKYWEGPNEYDQYYPPTQNPRGNAREAVRYARIMSEEFKAIDPNVKILSGNTIYFTGIEAWDEFLKNGGGEYVDAFAHHGDNIHTHNLKSLFDSYGYGNKEVWITESGIGPNCDCRSFALEKLLVSYTGGDKRFAWYSSDTSDFKIMTAPNQPTIAGEGLKKSGQWLLGTKILNIEIKPNGTHISKVVLPNGKIGYFVWQKAFTEAQNLDIPASWRIVQREDILSAVSTFSSGNLTLAKGNAYLLTTDILENQSLSSSSSSQAQSSIVSSQNSSVVSSQTISSSISNNSTPTTSSNISSNSSQTSNQNSAISSQESSSNISSVENNSQNSSVGVSSAISSQNSSVVLSQNSSQNLISSSVSVQTSSVISSQNSSIISSQNISSTQTQISSNTSSAISSTITSSPITSQTNQVSSINSNVISSGQSSTIQNQTSSTISNNNSQISSQISNNSSQRSQNSSISCQIVVPLNDPCPNPNSSSSAVSSVSNTISSQTSSAISTISNISTASQINQNSAVSTISSTVSSLTSSQNSSSATSQNSSLSSLSSRSKIRTKRFDNLFSKGRITVELDNPDCDGFDNINELPQMLGYVEFKATCGRTRIKTYWEDLDINSVYRFVKFNVLTNQKDYSIPATISKEIKNGRVSWVSVHTIEDSYSNGEQKGRGNYSRSQGKIHDPYTLELVLMGANTGTNITNSNTLILPTTIQAQLIQPNINIVNGNNNNSNTNGVNNDNLSANANANQNIENGTINGRPSTVRTGGLNNQNSAIVALSLLLVTTLLFVVGRKRNRF